MLDKIVLKKNFSVLKSTEAHNKQRKTLKTTEVMVRTEWACSVVLPHPMPGLVATDRRDTLDLMHLTKW